LTPVSLSGADDAGCQQMTQRFFLRRTNRQFRRFARWLVAHGIESRLLLMSPSLRFPSLPWPLLSPPPPLKPLAQRSGQATPQIIRKSDLGSQCRVENLILKKSLGNITRAVDIMFPKNVSQGRFVLLEQALWMPMSLLSNSNLGIRPRQIVPRDTHFTLHACRRAYLGRSVFSPLVP
jgi:hypothetical protein